MNREGKKNSVSQTRENICMRKFKWIERIERDERTRQGDIIREDATKVDTARTKSYIYYCCSFFKSDFEVATLNVFYISARWIGDSLVECIASVFGYKTEQKYLMLRSQHQFPLKNAIWPRNVS